MRSERLLPYMPVLFNVPLTVLLAIAYGAKQPIGLIAVEQRGFFSLIFLPGWVYLLVFTIASITSALQFLPTRVRILTLLPGLLYGFNLTTDTHIWTQSLLLGHYVGTGMVGLTVGMIALSKLAQIERQLAQVLQSQIVSQEAHSQLLTDHNKLRVKNGLEPLNVPMSGFVSGTYGTTIGNES